MPRARRGGTHLVSHVNNDDQAKLEESLGIIHRVSPLDSGWTGRMRIRYTDFQVHEIPQDGKVLHLSNYAEPMKPASEQTRPADMPKLTKPAEPAKPSGNNVSPISSANREALVTLLGEDVTAELVEMDTAIVNALANKNVHKGSVVFGPIEDRDKRTKIHQMIRQAFMSRMESKVSEQSFVVTQSVPNSQSRGGGPGRGNNRGKRASQPSFDSLGGHFCHFTLYKENRDSMETISHIARILNGKPSDFGVAGTKDRRAATVQRVSAFRRRPEELNRVNLVMGQSKLGIRVGDFKFEKYGLQLGDLMGNEFVISLKECQVVRTPGYSMEHKMETLKARVAASLKYAAQNGFLNYYGLQRFGTYDIGTHQIGTKILQADFQGAVDMLLKYDSSLLDDRNEGQDVPPHIRDDINRAKACSLFKQSRTAVDAKKACEIVPRKYTAESIILRHLSHSPTDYCGALLKTPRGLRTMYVHGYQSFIWNHVASKRWALHGRKVVEGDLVLCEKKAATSAGQMLDQDGEDVVNPIVDSDDIARARPLSKKEAESGKYSIDDVVLPTPGWDIVYPKNEIGEYYKKFMGCPKNGGLDPHNMRRPQKDFSLPGAYRKIIGHFIGEPSFEVITYSDNDIQLAKTDLDLIHEDRARCQQIEDEKRARFQKKEEVRERLARENQSKWLNFSKNPTAHDEEAARKALGEKRHREAENPGIDLDQHTVNETWVKTGENDNAKRFKLSREELSYSTATPSLDSKPAAAALDLSKNITEPSPASVQKEIDQIVAEAERVSTQDIAAQEAAEQAALKHVAEIQQHVLPPFEIPKDISGAGNKSNWPGTPDPMAVDPKTNEELSTGVEEQKKEAVSSRPIAVDTKPAAETSTGVEEQKEVVSPEDNTMLSKPADKTPTNNEEQDDAISSVMKEPSVKLAVILRFKLNSSQYATMAIRELTTTMATNPEEPPIKEANDEVHNVEACNDNNRHL